MYRSSFIAAFAFGGAVLVSAPMAFAQTGPANPSQSLAQPGRAFEHESRADIHRFEQVPVSLTQAIGQAESYSQGRAIDASFAIEKGKPVYDVKTFGKAKLWEGTVDAHSGAVLATRSATPEAQLDPKEISQLNKLQKDQTSLAEAVKAAEQRTGGKAIDGKLAQHGATLAYQVGTVKNGAIDLAMINPQNGQVASIRQETPNVMSGSSVPRAPAATLPQGASTDRGLGAPPPGSTRQAPQSR